MNDISQRLVQCFQAVFPELSPQEIAGASIDSVTRWDSLTSVTLLSLVEEEFEISVDFDRFEELNSFAGLLRYVSEQTQ